MCAACEDRSCIKSPAQDPCMTHFQTGANFAGCHHHRGDERAIRLADTEWHTTHMGAGFNVGSQCVGSGPVDILRCSRSHEVHYGESVGNSKFFGRSRQEVTEHLWCHGAFCTILLPLSPFSGQELFCLNPRSIYKYILSQAMTRSSTRLYEDKSEVVQLHI